MAPSRRDEFVELMLRLNQSSERARRELELYEAANDEVVGRVRRGEGIEQAVAAVALAFSHRQSLTETLETFEAARHDARLALFALAAEQGSSVAELARQFGFSRQLASRLAREAMQVD